jgi:hypothetical protein
MNHKWAPSGIAEELFSPPFLIFVEVSVRFSTSVVILLECDSEECEVLHIYPTKV